MDNTMLNRFYEDNVKMSRDETSKSVNLVIPIVQDILQYVHDRDCRFKVQPLTVGSYYSHLKVSRADEFDYSVVFDTPALQWTTGTAAYYGFDDNKQVVRKSIPLPSAPVGKCFTQLDSLIPQWNQQGLNQGQACLTIDDDIIPIKVKRYFKQLVSEAVNRPRIRQYVDAKRLSESPATTLTINHPNISGSISIDLAPIIEARLPFKTEFGWPRSGTLWPTRQKIEEIKAIGLNEVAKDPFYWDLSFVTCEKALLDGIDANGTCRKKSERIMKKLKDMWCPRGMKQELTSYHLKNILFWECENHPSDSDWSNEQLATMVKSMCYLLVQHIQRGKLPCYFHTGIDLFQNKDMETLQQVGKNILTFLSNPPQYL